MLWIRADELDVGRLESPEGSLCRAIHEALVNLDQHARATGVAISLRSESGTLELEIRDDCVELD